MCQEIHVDWLPMISNDRLWVGIITHCVQLLKHLGGPSPLTRFLLSVRNHWSRLKVYLVQLHEQGVNNCAKSTPILAL